MRNGFTIDASSRRRAPRAFRRLASANFGWANLGSEFLGSAMPWAGAKLAMLVVAACLVHAAPAKADELSTIAILAPEAATDFGWNQQGVAAARAAADKAGVKVLVAENLGYDDVRPVLRELAEDGAGLLIAHASGYNTAAPEIGAELGVPVAITDRPQAREPGKVADYTASGHEGAYLAGRLAGRLSRTGTLGIVTSGEPPGWNSQSAAFAQGARAEKPDIVIRYAVIGPAAYSDAAGARRVTETVIAAGADIIFGQGNGSSFGMLAAVEATPAVDGGKVWFIDVIGDKTPIDKGHLLSSVIWNLEPVFSAIIADVKAGTFGERNYGIALRDDSVSLLKTPHIPEDAWRHIEGIRQDIIDGKITLTPVFDAAGVHALVTSATRAP
ncbi:putative B6 ABC transporter substrate-binding protein [Pseudochelatococcus contaminans]|uniref:Simple sugar transport system substrate-binding protein n=1 Tax=Pseudochelatococcus contaminans TaxID=1538103 RepID=A0A7W5Z2N2_9HYPH|nr:BMP family protein [Pseudochelatococcus contaminans]MBB3809018.1 simple sugar transport system substrate-binding protein [Pseudochelatococcus contaminans]